MTPTGYAGKILYVDLTRGTCEARPLDPQFAREWIGGLGFVVKLYFDTLGGLTDPDPLSADNPFIIAPGPLTGQRLNAVARWTVGSRSPLTGFWGDANVGGYFGAELKRAGYDAVVITGAAPVPSYLYIEDTAAEVRDATPYWGLDTYELDDTMRADLRGNAKRPGETLSIGPAGETLVRFASLVTRKGHVAGRTGMGAVWGAKRLKAVFVRGSGGVEAAHPGDLAALRTELDGVYRDSITVEGLRAFGTASHMDVGVILGDIPMQNWSRSDWERFDELSPLAYQEKILTGSGTCHACGVQCKREAEVNSGAFRFERGPGPEYETIATFGTMCLNPVLESVGKANDICNRYGMDTISCGSTIAWCIDCFERGLISAQDTGGLTLNWGASEAIVALTEQIGRRQGFGALLGEGSERAAMVLGGGSDALLTTVKGLEAPMHDPRGSHGYGLAYAVAPRGACHMASLEFPVEGGGMYVPDIPELAEEIVGMESEGKAALNVATQDYGMFFSGCAGFCNLGGLVLTAGQAVAAVNAVTGSGYTLDEVLRLGRRIWYLQRGLSNLFGVRAHHDTLPAKLMTPLPEGPTEGSVPELSLMLSEFYSLRGLDETGQPRRDVLEAVGLPQLAEVLHGM
jgi:aldehyde:ferredoxin oxidoreductase